MLKSTQRPEWTGHYVALRNLEVAMKEQKVLIVESQNTTPEKELTVEDHIHLLHLAKNARGKIVISGYPSPLYNRTLKNWRCKKKNVANHSSQAKVKERRIECLWMNY